MAKRQYTNVYTILDKARKGELELQEQPSSLFKSVVPYKRPDIIMPSVHYLDERVINRYVTNHLLSSKNIQNVAQYMNSIGIMKSPVEVQRDLGDITHKFPKGLKNDFFNLFNKDVSELNFTDRGENNKMRYKFIEKANQPVHKIMTKGSHAKSLIFTQHVMEYFTKVMLTQKYKNEEQFEQMQQQMEQEVKMCMNPQPGPGQPQAGQSQQQSSPPQDQEQKQDSPDPSQEQPQDQQDQQDVQQPQQDLQDQPNSTDSGPSQSNEAQGGNSASKGGETSDSSMTEKQMEKMLNDMLNKKTHELEEIMDKAQQACEMLNEAYTTEEQNDLWQQAQGTEIGAGVLNMETIEQMATQLKSIKMAMGGVKQFIKKIMDNSVSYFSAKEQNTYEPLLDSGHIDQVQDVFMLHPKLRKFMIDDIMVKETKKIGKINLYIDNSGSMSSSCGARDEEGNYIDRINFAKGFALKMLEMDLLNEVFTFNDRVLKRKTTVTDITKIKPSGGTDTTNVARHIKNAGINAIVITDGTDRCDIYSEKAYFIGTEGANFRGFCDLEEYKKQMCVFDGNSVRKIDSKGYPI